MTILLFALLQDPLQEVEELRREVELCRTMSSLQLSKEQIERLVPVLRNGRKAAQEVAAEKKEEIEALKSALRELREELEKNGAASPESERRVAEAQRHWGETMRRSHEANERLADAVKEILTEAQWKALSKAHGPDPTRPIREQILRFIDRLLEDPNEEMVDEFVTRLREQIRRMARPLGLSEDDVDAELKRIAKVVEEMLGASPEDLAKKKDDYVRRALEEGKIGEASKRGGPAPEEGRRRTVQLLLQPEVLRFLEKRLEHSK